MNRPKIIELPIELSNMIAAGEVVERPSSVVKELVENSIDAKATFIKIDLMNAGIDKITVIDDGIGLSSEDIAMAVKPHATSKIKSASDLFAIETLGFRGEAIPSICAISKMTITSSLNGYEASFKKYEGLKLIDEGKTSFTQGTKIEVSDLFFNTPARYKHLSSEQVELSHIVQLVNKISLAYPEIAFVLTNNAKVLFSTDGNSNYEAIIAEIFGTDVAKQMITFNAKSSLYEIKGYTSSNSIFRSNKNGIIIMINQRIIKNANLVYAILDAYKTYLPVGRYPVTIVEIKANPTYVDVNVHPTKQEVRFTDEKELRYLITNTILDALKKVELVYEVKPDELKNIVVEEAKTVKEKDFESDIKSFKWDDFPKGSLENNTSDAFNESSLPKKSDTTISEEQAFYYDTSYQDAESTNNKKQQLSFNFRDDHNFFQSLSYLGQFNLTYLLFEKDDNLYLIDQHAAMERIMYEKIKEELQKPCESFYDLLIPLEITLPDFELNLLDDKKAFLTHIGITYDIGKNHIVKIKTIPTWINQNFASESLDAILSDVINDLPVSKDAFYDEFAKTMSCKKSIKANMHILTEEVSCLLQDLDNCSNPFTCPHGRPTIIHFTKYEIEKFFKRVN